MQSAREATELQALEPERCAAERGELRAHERLVEARARRFRERRGALRKGCRVTTAGARPQRFAGAPLERQRDRQAPRGLAEPERALDLALDRRVSAHPHELPGLHAPEIRPRNAKPQAPAIVRAFGAEDWAALLVLVLRVASVEHDAHARSHLEFLGLRSLARAAGAAEAGERRIRSALRTARARLRRETAGPRPAREVALDPHARALDALDHAEVEAAVLGEAPFDQRLVVAAAEESVAEAARVGEGRAQQVAPHARDGFLALRERVDVVAIRLRRRRHVGRVLLAPLDLEAVHADARELLDRAHAGEILRAQQVLHVAELALLAVDDEVVGHATGLGALAAIRRATAPRLAGETLAGPRHAQRAVDEHLELDVGALAEQRDLVDREFARHDHARGPERARELGALGARDRHLRAGVHFERGTSRACDARHSRVLHDERIDSGLRGEAHDALDQLELRLEHERVEREVGTRSGAVDARHGLRQALRSEVPGARPGIEALGEPEVDAVGSRPQRRGKGRVIPRRREHLRHAFSAAFHGVRR